MTTKEPGETESLSLPTGEDETAGEAPAAKAVMAGRLVVVAHVAAIAIAGIAVSVLEFRLGASLGTDSTRFAVASHLLEGRIPYRSLVTEDPPGAYAFNALVLALFGRTMAAQHLATLLAGSLVYPLVTYWVARAFLKRRSLALVAALCVVVLFSSAPGVQLAPALVALGLAARWVQGSRVTVLFSAGVATGVELMFSTGLAASVVGAVAFTIALRALTLRRTATGHERVETIRPSLGYVLGCCAGALPFLAAVAAEGSLRGWFAETAQAIGRSLQSAGPDAAAVTEARYLLPFAIVPVVICVLARAAREEDERERALTGSLLAAAATLRLAAPAGSPEADKLALAVADLPLLTAFFLDWAISARGRIVMTRVDASFAAGVGLLTAGLWRLDPGRPAFAVVGLIGALVVGTVRLQRRPPAGGRRRVIRVTAPVLALSVTLVATLVSPGRLVANEADGTQLSGAYWDPATAEQITAAVESLRGAAPPGSPIFVFPEAGALYELSGRRNPTSFVRLTAASRDRDVQRVLKELADDEPAAVLIRYEQAARRSAQVGRVTRYLEDRYIETRRLDEPELWGIWVRREPPELCRRLLLYTFEQRQAEPLPEVTPVVDGRQVPVVVQRAGEVRFSFELRPGAEVQFTPGPVADAPEVSGRAIEVVAGGQTQRIWEGAADGIKRRFGIDKLAPGPAEVVLRSPPGLTTQWTEPTVCAP